MSGLKLIYACPQSHMPPGAVCVRENLEEGDWTDINPWALSLKFPSRLEINIPKNLFSGKVVFYDSFSFLFWSGYTYQSVGNFENLYRYVANRNEFQFRKDVDISKAVYVSKHKVPRSECSNTFRPEEINDLARETPVLIDLNDMYLEELNDVLSKVGPQVYYENGFLFKDLFFQKRPEQIEFALILHPLSVILKGENYRLKFEFRRKPLKRKNLIESKCGYCKKPTTNIVPVKSFCRITDEIENMEVICVSCYENNSLVISSAVNKSKRSGAQC